MQVTEYMKMNHYHPNKAKILRIEKDWYDPDTERDDMEGTFKLSTLTSSSSLSGLVQNGPSCPTCGASIEPGTHLYSEIANSS